MTGMKRLSHAHQVYSVRPSILNRCGISRTDLETKALFLPAHCRKPRHEMGGEGAQLVHAAQHDSFATSFVNACAASLIPSDSVKYGWKVDVRSSIVSPNLIASAGSVIISPASAARMCAPMIFWVAPSATSLTNPRVSRAASALGTCSSGSFDASGSIPRARASFSVRPTEETAGSVKVTLGSAERS